MSRILFQWPSPLPPLGQCLFTRSPSLQRTACDLRIPPLAWSRLIRGSPSAGGSKNLRNRNQEQEGGGEPARPGHGFLCQRSSRGDEAGGREGNSHLPFKTHLTYKITQIWGNFYLLPWTGFLFHCWLVKRGEVNQKDSEKEVQGLAMSFLVCAWQGHFPFPPGALVNLELPFVKDLLCIRHDTAFFFLLFQVVCGIFFLQPREQTCAPCIGSVDS